MMFSMRQVASKMFPLGEADGAKVRATLWATALGLDAPVVDELWGRVR